MKNLTIALFALTFSASNSLAEIIFSDSFESGSLSAASNDVFQWENPNRTSIVTMEPGCNGLSSGDPTVIYNGNVTCDGPIAGRNWQAFTGKNSLRFRYPAGVNMSEQRFHLSSAYRELWIGFWLRIPENFQYGPNGDPNKLFAIWMDGYSQAGDGSTVWLSMWRDSNNGAKLGYTYSLGSNTASTSFKQVRAFISPQDAGKWMHLTIHVRAESSPGKSDGIIQTYISRENEVEQQQFHVDTAAPLKLPSNGPNGFSHGYLLGWANATYIENTEWLIDDFVISSAPLIITPKSVKNISIN